MFRKVSILVPLCFAVMGAAPRPSAPLSSDKGKRCIESAQVAAPVVRDDGLLYFRGQPDYKKSYIAVFKGESCRRLNQFASASIDSWQSRYCGGDTVRVYMPPTKVPGPSCVIDHFLPFAGHVDDPVSGTEPKKN
ncbi:hypothetical protein [Novosphingobium beihaiensis]|uniref:Beta/gamma crystallin n=1 Tax=Novosphingobium beihaiensis TaxID=2930389 RepID=A0ABT0BL53_9SPHN|nr:hypothetical protein [Novosphingobium beihaiensis]MCJ2185772.1 hypothetical protein [Novosphingobium beihaiensis]